LYVSW